MADGTGTSSVGLMGLPHFRTSRISRELWEPVYLNLFTVEIELPAKMSTSEDDKMLLLEGVQKVGGLNTSKNPGLAETQKYKMAERSFAASGTGTTTVDLQLEFEVNLRGCDVGKPDMFTVKMLRRWSDLIWDPLTGRQGIKVDYVAPSMTITMHDKKNQPFWQWTFRNVFPTKDITVPDLNYQSKTNLYRVTGFELRADMWDESML